MKDEKGEKKGLYIFAEERGKDIRKKKRIRCEEDSCNDEQGLGNEDSGKYSDLCDRVAWEKKLTSVMLTRIAR